MNLNGSEIYTKTVGNVMRYFERKVTFRFNKLNAKLLAGLLYFK